MNKHEITITVKPGWCRDMVKHHLLKLGYKRGNGQGMDFSGKIPRGDFTLSPPKGIHWDEFRRK